MKPITIDHQKPKKGFLLFIIFMGIILFLQYVTPGIVEQFKPWTFGGLARTIILYFTLFRWLPGLVRGKGGKLLDFIPNRNGGEMSLSINRAVTIRNPFAGIFISGGAGSGKSKSLIEPLIKEAGKKDYTGIIYDFKWPELAQYVATAYQDSPVKQYYFNFDDLNRSHRINPIAPELMTKESFAREFAFCILANLNPQMISRPDFWSDNSTTLLTAIFWYLREKHPVFCTLPHAIAMALQPNMEALLMELSTVPKCADMISSIMTAFERGADNQLAGVLSSLQVSLSKINLDEIYYLMSGSDFSLQLNDPESRGILTIGNNPQLSTTYAPIIGLILTSVSKQLNRPGKEKSVFMLDEFPTIYVPNVEQLPATARSNKVATILACQDITQIVDRYGKEKAETILSNLGNQFYGRTPNPQTARRVSEIFGKTDREVLSSSREGGIFGGDEITTTTTTRTEEIVKMQEVAQLNTGTFFTILSEGEHRQGKSTIPLDKGFKKSEILSNAGVDENDLKQAYRRVTLDITEVVLAGAIHHQRQNRK